MRRMHKASESKKHCGTAVKLLICVKESSILHQIIMPTSNALITLAVNVGLDDLTYVLKNQITLIYLVTTIFILYKNVYIFKSADMGSSRFTPVPVSVYLMSISLCVFCSFPFLLISISSKNHRRKP